MSNDIPEWAKASEQIHDCPPWHRHDAADSQAAEEEDESA